MKQALIAKNEKVIKNGVELGLRIAEITPNPFEVHSDLFWTRCNDDVTSHEYYFEPNSYQLLPIPK